MKRSISMAGIVLLVTSVAWGAAAEDPTLRGIMQELGAQMGRLAEAVVADDLPAAESAAAAIAEHPRPALGERVRILSNLGSDAAAFRRADSAVHEAAVAVGEAAKAGDRAALAARFHALTDACLACHSEFRARVRTSIESTQEP